MVDKKTYLNTYLPKYQSSFHNENDIEAVRNKYILMGIQILKDVDDLTVEVRFPDGWSATNDGYWTTYYDNAGRERMSCFNKECFWDYDRIVHFKE